MRPPRSSCRLEAEDAGQHQRGPEQPGRACRLGEDDDSDQHRADGAFGRAQPGLDLRLSIASAMADLGRNEADIAIRPTLAPSETLVGTRVGSFDYAVYTRASGALPASLPTLLASRGRVAFAGAIAPAARWLAANLPEENRYAAVDAMPAAAMAARSGAYALLPSYLSDDPMLGLIHPDLRYAARVRAFMDFAGSALRKALRQA